MDVAAQRELDGVAADCGAAAVDDERGGLCGGRPGLRQHEAGVEAYCAGKSGEWKGGAFFERGLIWKGKGGASPGEAVLGVGAVRGHHLVEGGDAVIDLEAIA